jgi:hypothetical protein
VDDQRFDAFIRVLGDDATRRRVLGALAGVAGLRLSEAVAKNHDQRSGKGRGQAKSGVNAAADPGQGQGRYQTLATKWWAWAIDEEFAPIIEEGDVDCAAGQQGNTWFLAGGFFPPPTTIERRCTVPKGTKLFFPVLNQFCAGPPAFDSGESTHRIQKQLAERLACAAKGLADTGIDPADLTATVDGKSVPIVRAHSALFPIHLGDPNVFKAPPGNYLEAADGYWVLLDPLSPGTHEVHFAADAVLDVTYEITVV